MFGVGLRGIGLAGAALSKGGGIDLNAFMAAQSDGLWFDFTKTDRLFQENTGPTPANDPGEVIGLALSQRAWNGKTLAELLAGQTELVANGGFDTNTVWSASGVTASNTAIIADGKLTINSADGANVQVTQGFPVPSGRLLCIEFFIDSLSSGSWGIADSGAIIATGSTTGLHRLFYTSPDAALSLDIKRGGGVTNFVMDRISVKEVPGKHGTQATPNFKPKYQAGGGAGFDSVDDNLLTPYTAGAGANFIVAKVTVPASLSGLQVIAGAKATNERLYIGVDTNGRPAYGAGNANGANAAWPDIRGQTLAVAITVNGSTLRLFAGEALLSEAVQSGDVNSGQGIRVGGLNNGGTASNFFGGTIHSLVAGREFIDLATFRKIAAKL